MIFGQSGGEVFDSQGEAGDGAHGSVLLNHRQIVIAVNSSRRHSRGIGPQRSAHGRPACIPLVASSFPEMTNRSAHRLISAGVEAPSRFAVNVLPYGMLMPLSGGTAQQHNRLVVAGLGDPRPVSSMCFIGALVGFHLRGCRVGHNEDLSAMVEK